MEYLILRNTGFNQGVGQKFETKQEFLDKLSSMIDDSIINQATGFCVNVTTDAIV